jgi:hypothetical protein
MGYFAVWLTRATRRNIPEDTILHSHRRENLKSYKKNPITILGFELPIKYINKIDNQVLWFLLQSSIEDSTSTSGFRLRAMELHYSQHCTSSEYH